MTSFARVCRSATINGSGARPWLGSCVVGVLGFLVARRGAGAMHAPSPAWVYLLAGIAAAGLAWWFRQGLIERVGRWPAFIAVGIASLAGAASISMGGIQAMGLLALWLPMVGETALALGRTTVPQRVSCNAMPDVAHASGAILAIDSPLAETALVDPAVEQYLVRRRDEVTGETISGYLRAHFAVAERTVNLHVPFCPPLPSVPACEAEAVDGPPARVKVVQVLPQGARLEVRLDEAATAAQQVVVEFTTLGS